YRWGTRAMLDARIGKRSSVTEAYIAATSSGTVRGCSIVALAIFVVLALVAHPPSARDRMPAEPSRTWRRLIFDITDRYFLRSRVGEEDWRRLAAGPGGNCPSRWEG